jgi:hypothetical protein
VKRILVAVTVLTAIHLAPVSAAERDVIERARLAFSEQLRLACSVNGEYGWIAEHAVYQYPLAGIDMTLRVEGRDAVANHLREISEIDPATQVENIAYYPTLDRNIVFVQYDRVSHGESVERRPIVAIIEMRGDQIVKFTQLNGARESLQAVNAVSGAIR